MNTLTRTHAEERATVTFHTSPAVKKRLDKLALITNRSRSFLTNKAVEQYLAEEEDFIASVKEGIADADAGRVYTASEVKKHITKHFGKAR
jgi:predicted transcriptional regulator